MSNNIVVAVSPFYTGAGWEDSFTGIVFKPNQAYHPIQINEDQDLTGIRRSLRLNSLILLKGTLSPAESITATKLDPAELNTEQLEELVKSDTQAEDKAAAEFLEKETQLNTTIEALNAEVKALKADKTKVTKEHNKIVKEKDTLIEGLLALLAENNIEVPETLTK
ncbi:hypothetical protein ACFC9N_10575 [Enterococcus casseliflavus]|uniref:hypothetical protein n=1 Tax=Enterococcus TaxID=1350 RepID=UPI000A3B78B1|nr:hypothetical protein [Enterococcus sp. 4E1_DIV0656]OTO09111.1 hypothetical protein A5882_003441 [Enterococcus sp. 4E1_DIV0656]